MGNNAQPRLISPPSRARRGWYAVRGVVVPASTLLTLVIVWEVCARMFSIPVYLLPSPSRIYAELAGMAPELWPNTWATLRTVLLGFLMSLALAMPMAVIIASFRPVARAVYPLLIVTQSTPIIAIAPILVVIMGTGHASRVTITFLIAFFPLLVSTATGLMSTPRDMVDLSRVMRTSFLQDLWLVRLPHAVPFIFSGLRVAITLSVIGAVVAEFVSANRGLGFLITQSTAYFNVPVAFGAVVLLAVMGVTLFSLVVLVERLCFPWAVNDARHEQD